MPEQTRRVRAKVNNPYRCYLCFHIIPLLNTTRLPQNPYHFPSDSQRVSVESAFQTAIGVVIWGNAMRPVVFVLSPSQGGTLYIQTQPQIQTPAQHAALLETKRPQRSFAIFVYMVLLCRYNQYAILLYTL